MLDIDELNVRKIELWGSTKDLFKENINFQNKN
jgi:hypothetical protein